jgi:hypothetical protein
MSRVAIRWTVPAMLVLLAACGSSPATKLTAVAGGAPVRSTTTMLSTPAESPSIIGGTAVATSGGTVGRAGPGTTQLPSRSSTIPSTQPSSTTTETTPPTTKPPLPLAGSGVHGTVTAGPTCPVEQPGNPCPPRPVMAEITARDSSGVAIGTTRSQVDGRYALLLPAGRYTLTADPGSAFPRCAAAQATIPAGQVVETNITCDTGIR